MHESDSDSPPEDVDFRGVGVNTEECERGDVSPPVSQPFGVVESNERSK